MTSTKNYSFYCAKVFLFDGIHTSFTEKCGDAQTAIRRALTWKDRGYIARAEFVEYNENKSGFSVTVLA